jgi:predicted transcriptional regulator
LRQELNIHPELEAKLAHLASLQGRDTDSVVEDALTRYVADQTKFLAGVERGIAAADRGESPPTYKPSEIISSNNIPASSRPPSAKFTMQPNL